MSKLQDKYDDLCVGLEQDLQELEDANYEIQNVVDDITFVADDLRRAATSGDSEELQQVLNQIDGNSFVNELEDAQAVIRANSAHILKLVKVLTGLEKRLEIRYKDSNFIDILKTYKQRCGLIGIDIPKKPKSKKK